VGALFTRLLALLRMLLMQSLLLRLFRRLALLLRRLLAWLPTLRTSHALAWCCTAGLRLLRRWPRPICPRSVWQAAGLHCTGTWGRCCAIMHRLHLGLLMRACCRMP
jgi:hypothetical protein